jgi:hypothetical protein
MGGGENVEDDTTAEPPLPRSHFSAKFMKLEDG